LVLPSVALAVILKGCGFGMVLFLIAINGISPSVLEAAEIDGCTGFQRVRNVILPLVRPIILFMVITGLVGSLNAFTEIYAMTNNTGGPSMSFLGEALRAGRISGYHLYRTFDDGFYGRAAAISYILLLIALVISWLNFKILRTKED
ncbi:MAG TPA: sugar ABC transporter permease, partial [Candidatus Sumerlaeota bacterium]|nr:sugar ABC transporter permease [Candidatus Sumerlaeota bacterium]